MIQIATQILFTVLGWLVLMYLSVNLIGVLLRGLVVVQSTEDALSNLNPKLREATQSTTDKLYDPKLEKKINIFAAFLLIMYLVVLFYFWNIGVCLVGIAFMLLRMPDLLWEIKHGKGTLGDMPTPMKYLGIIDWALIPVLWFSLYRI